VKYRGVIKSISIKENDLMVAVDDQHWDGLDQETQDGVRDSSLAAWTKTWQEHHPHRHVTLHVYIMGYFGERLGSTSRSL
ncbi:MAG: hypothetical protein M3160_07600, partial [Candidatus Eremiobacteraeota bacterium]|nr:hypothetical protein [Candidatus Eremiobacteraeota bacterium]